MARPDRHIGSATDDLPDAHPARLATAVRYVPAAPALGVIPSHDGDRRSKQPGWWLAGSDMRPGRQDARASPVRRNYVGRRKGAPPGPFPVRLEGGPPTPEPLVCRFRGEARGPSTPLPVTGLDQRRIGDEAPVCPSTGRTGWRRHGDQRGVAVAAQPPRQLAVFPRWSHRCLGLVQASSPAKSQSWPSGTSLEKSAASSIIARAWPHRSGTDRREAEGSESGNFLS